MGSGAASAVAKADAAKTGQKVPQVSADTMIYDRILSRSEFDGLSKPTILKIQQELALIYQKFPGWERDFSLPKQPLADGVIGSVTLFWLQRFCFNFKVAPTGDFARHLPPNVTRIANFGKTNPNELAILLSADFAYWDETQPDTVRKEDFLVRAKGGDAELIALVTRYLQSKNRPSPAAVTEPVKTGNGGKIHAYSLTAGDLDKLATKDQIILALTALKDKGFDTPEALKAAVNNALGNQESLLTRLWPGIERQIVDTIGYQITDTTIADLKAQTIPESILGVLAKMNDSYFQDKASFEEKLNDSLKDLADDYKPILPLILAQAEVVDSVSLNAQSLINLKNELKNDIRNIGVSAVIVKALKEIQDISYPELALFQSAARAKITSALGTCPKNRPSDDQYVAAMRIGNDDLALLQSDVNSLEAGLGQRGGKLDLSRIFEHFKTTRAYQTACSQDQIKQISQDVQDIYKVFWGPTIDAAAEKLYPYAGGTPIQWSGANCGCVLDDLSGVVVGFYPYWANQGKVQQINFSVLSRIAYYGLTFDDLGDLRHSNDLTGNGSFNIADGSEKTNAFISTAHTFHSNIDWVVQKNDWNGDWKNYPRARKLAILRKLAENIITLLHTPLTDTFSKIVPYITLGRKSQPRRGDGVTLYFSDYPQDTDSTLLFNEFFGILKQGLAEDANLVNILISQHALNNKDGAFGMPNLVKLRNFDIVVKGVSAKKLAAKNGFFMILLDEPSSDAKKKLRLDIEAEHSLSGITRANFLHGIVPILQFDSRNWQQLDDDIVYAKDNFAGIGFWPLPLANLALPLGDASQTCASAKQLAACLIQRYQTEGAATVMMLQRQVCEHRWGLRIMMDVFILIGLLLAYLYFQSCSAQSLIREYFLWVLATVLMPPVVIFTLLLFYDPSLISLSKGNLPFIIALAVIIFGTIGGYAYLRSQREKPSRQRALPQRQTGTRPWQ